MTAADALPFSGATTLRTSVGATEGTDAGPGAAGVEATGAGAAGPGATGVEAAGAEAAGPEAKEGVGIADCATGGEEFAGGVDPAMTGASSG